MEIKKNSGNGETTGNKETKEAVLRYLLWFGKENKFRLARVFGIGTEEVLAALQTLENEGKVEMIGSKARSTTRSRPYTRPYIIKSRPQLPESRRKERPGGAEEPTELEEVEPASAGEEAGTEIKPGPAD